MSPRTVGGVMSPLTHLLTSYTARLSHQQMESSATVNKSQVVNSTRINTSCGVVPGLDQRRLIVLEMAHAPR